MTMPSTPPPAAPARARRLLLAVVQRTHQCEVAARCGVHKSQVTRWLIGESLPSPTARMILARCYRIPSDAWQ
jgi:transcriptional regulator with XRE-family HTH domain